MTDLAGKRFVASYSGGKDSVLAIHRAVKAGLVPHSLMTTYNTDVGRSWFHGLPERLLALISKSTGINIKLIRTSGAEYALNFENALRAFKAEGADICVFGDIDIDEHRKWCTDRCENVGMTPLFPLWQESRRELVFEFIDSGFLTVITTVDTSRMPDTFLGRTLTRDVAEEIAACGADICGENGEYHTFTYDGPIFSAPIDYQTSERINNGNYSSLAIE